RAQVAARSGHAISWDNTHLTLSVHVKQRTLGPAKVQTGTKIPEYVLRGLSDPEWLNLIPIIKRRATAPPNYLCGRYPTNYVPVRGDPKSSPYIHFQVTNRMRTRPELSERCARISAPQDIQHKSMCCVP
ncbi:hypothetical protein B0H14DRAFT_2338246, partial [Mycena olivaceomarginata]